MAGLRRPSAMDRFPDGDGHHVWLQSREHGTYLHADEDGHGVSLSRRRMSLNTAWVVDHYQGDAHHVLLHSAAYGSYLSATDASAPLGCRGFRVVQRNCDDLEEDAIRWRPISVGLRPDIWLRRVAEGDRSSYLRANGGYLRWNAKVVSVDDVSNICTMMQWVVVPIPSRERIPRLPRPTWLPLSALLPSRVVMANGEGCSFSFRGRSVFRLRKELIHRLGISPDVSDNLVMYVRAGTQGQLTPLVVNLPRSRQTLVITVETPANGGPRYPDFEQVS